MNTKKFFTSLLIFGALIVSSCSSDLNDSAYDSVDKTKITKGPDAVDKTKITIGPRGVDKTKVTIKPKSN